MSNEKMYSGMLNDTITTYDKPYVVVGWESGDSVCQFDTEKAAREWIAGEKWNKWFTHQAGFFRHSGVSGDDWEQIAL
jgi:hypothetical protein